MKKMKILMCFAMLLLILGQECSIMAAENLLPSGVCAVDLKEFCRFAACGPRRVIDL